MRFSKNHLAQMLFVFVLCKHYRSVLDISNDAMLASEKGFTRIAEGLKLVTQLTPSNTSSLQIKAWKDSCYEAMNDDFNTPILIAQLLKVLNM